MKKLLLGFILVMWAFVAQGQTTLNYGYDGAGNQIYRGLNVYVPGARLANPAKSDSTISELDSTYQITVYPNPTTGILNINILGVPEGGTVKYSVFDIKGNLPALNGDVTTFSTIDLSNSANGIYILALLVNGKRKEWKIVKE